MNEYTYFNTILWKYNETSTGVLSDLAEIRLAIDAANHPALFLVDAISSLVAADFRQEEWGIDVAITASQKGLMLPAGLCFNALSEKAMRVSQRNAQAIGYWSWAQMLAANAAGTFPYTPAINLLFGLEAALQLIEAEGLDQIVLRHARHAAAVRTAFYALGLELVCLDRLAYSPSVTAVLLPEGHDAGRFCASVRDRFKLTLATGLGRFAERGFRLAHLGDINDLTILACLSGVEMGLAVNAIPHCPGGVARAMRFYEEAYLPPISLEAAA